MREDVALFNGEKFEIEKSLDWINSRFLFCTRSAIFLWNDIIVPIIKGTTSQTLWFLLQRIPNFSVMENDITLHCNELRKHYAESHDARSKLISMNFIYMWNCFSIIIFFMAASVNNLVMINTFMNA